LLCVAALLALAAVGVKRFLAREAEQRAKALTGYIADSAALTREFAAFTGKLATDGSAAQFEQAAALARQADYAGALAVLETLSREAAVPVVFNDMGVLYAKLNDRARAVSAFREALARDMDYAPVRRNLQRLRAQPNAVYPVTAEVEPNDTNEHANYIGLNQPVEGEIDAANADVDCFRFVTPAAPRDLIEVSILNRSRTLAPRIRFYDGEGKLLPWEKTVWDPGASLSLIVSPEPNVPLYVDVFGYGSTGGAYTLLVKPLKAFDQYEPNDDIHSARQIPLGRKIDANIMDAADVDFYSFVAERTGSVAIDIRNRSATLIPAVTTFGPDLQASGLGPDARKPGDSLHHSMAVREGTTYYLEVRPRAQSFGDYSLTLISRPF